MQLSGRQLKNFKILCTVLLCMILIICLFVKPIKQTFSYIQTTSGTCVNTFIGEISTEPIDPIEPVDPVNPPDTTDSPSDSSGGDETAKTGDTFNLGAWVLLTQISLLALMVLLFVQSKKTPKKSKR